MYVIQNTKTGRYVSRPGSAHSYTARLEQACTWSTRESAEREICPDNERVVRTTDLIGWG
jgi:hypothetical protein